MGRYAYFPIVLIILAALLHRTLLFYTLYPYYENLVALNPTWLTWQFLPLDLLRDHLVDALWYLQQTPPLPHIVLGLIAKLVDSPWGVACVLAALHALISLVTALLLYKVLVEIALPKFWACLLVLIFLLSSDVVMLEYNSFGQTFYENLSMLLLIGVVQQYLVYSARRLNTGLLTLGVLCAALALTRASFAYFFIVLALMLLILPQFKWYKLIWFFLPVLIFQGGWALKNDRLYGYFSPAATSWTGSNLQAGMTKRLQGDELRNSILLQNSDYPPWFVRMTKEKGMVFWIHSWYETYIPATIKAQDAALTKKLPGNPPTNSLAQHEVSRWYQKAVMTYAKDHPQDYALGVLQSYQIFCLPIREYTRLFINILFVKKTLSEVWRDSGLQGLLRGDYDFGNDYMMQSPAPQKILADASKVVPSIQGNAWTLPYLPWLWYCANMLAIHMAGPLLLILWLRSCRRSADGDFLACLFLIYVYVAVISSIAEHDENNRFRLAVEPILTLIGVMVWLGWWRLLKIWQKDKAATPAAIKNPNSR